MRLARAVSVAMTVALATTIFQMETIAFASETATYTDSFVNASFKGSDGSLEWDDPWVEVGESDGQGRGAVIAIRQEACPEGPICLVIHSGAGLSEAGAMRTADVRFFGDLRLTYLLRTVVDGPEPSTPPRLQAQVSLDGSTWHTVDDLQLGGPSAGTVQRSRDLSNWISSEFALRFKVSGLPDTEGFAVLIDSVELRGAIAAETTTTTTSQTTSPIPGPDPRPSITTTAPLPGDSMGLASTTTTLPSPQTTTDATDDQGTTTSTSTTLAVGGAGGPAPPQSGIRQVPLGLQANYATDKFGDVGTDLPGVLGVDVEANYSMAAEVIRSSWIWMVALTLIIATAIVTGLDRRHSVGELG